MCYHHYNPFSSSASTWTIIVFHGFVLVIVWLTRIAMTVFHFNPLVWPAHGGTVPNEPYLALWNTNKIKRIESNTWCFMGNMCTISYFWHHSIVRIFVGPYSQHTLILALVDPVSTPTPCSLNDPMLTSHWWSLWNASESNITWIKICSFRIVDTSLMGRLVNGCLNMIYQGKMKDKMHSGFTGQGRSLLAHSCIRKNVYQIAVSLYPMFVWLFLN